MTNENHLPFAVASGLRLEVMRVKEFDHAYGV